MEQDKFMERIEDAQALYKRDDSRDRDEPFILYYFRRMVEAGVAKLRHEHRDQDGNRYLLVGVDPLEADLFHVLRNSFFYLLAQPDGRILHSGIIEKEATSFSAKAEIKISYTNQGVPQDYAQAADWYRKAADQGVARAQFNLGVLYDQGQGVPQDYAQAADWYRKAASQGIADAQYNLGLAYDQGRGVPQDYAQAVDWYRKAADQGNADAQLNLGVLYDHGQGVPQDYAQAVDWFQKAADQGVARAQFNLGLAYAKGQGVPQDYITAYKWVVIAHTIAKPMSKLYKASGKFMAALGSEMTAAQIAQAQREASAWYRQYEAKHQP